MSKLNAQVLVSKCIFLRAHGDSEGQGQGKSEMSFQHAHVPENKEVLKRMIEM